MPQPLADGKPELCERAEAEMKICDAPECNRPARTLSAEWCDLHRQRMRANGSLELLPTHRPIEERFWEKVDRRGDDECWPWKSPPDRQTGYGRLGLGGRGKGSRGAHRISYEINVGPIPEGLELDHLCVNRICVNPRHLEPVTHEENTRRAKRRWTHCIHGHEFNEQNTYWRKEGRRACRQCARERRHK